MKTTVLAAVAATALMASAAVAQDFDNTGITITAETGKFQFVLEGTANTGYNSFGVGYEVLSYGMGANTQSVLDVYATHHRAANEFSLGAEYTVTHTRNALSLHGAVDAEYFVSSQVLAVTPTLGAAYNAAEAVTVWGEVGYTLDATNSWARSGGLFEVGVDFAVASNVTLTPSIRHYFDGVGADNTQAHIGVSFKF
jgi:opacity protein-like surface antigen